MDTLNLICLGNVLGITLLVSLVYYVSGLTSPLPSFVSKYYNKPSQAATGSTARQTQVYPITAATVEGSEEKKATPSADGSDNCSETNLYTTATAGGELHENEDDNNENGDADDVELNGSRQQLVKPKTRKVRSKRHIMSNGEEYEYEALVNESEIQNSKMWMKLSQDILFVGRIVIILTTVIPIIIITAQL